MVEVDNETFEDLVNEGLEAMPEKYLKELKNVAILTEDMPRPDQLRKGGVQHGWFLYGLYEGIPRTRRGNNYTFVLPDKITIFRQPLMRAARDEAHLKELVKNTVWHEIAHHFGLGHDQIHALEQQAKQKGTKQCPFCSMHEGRRVLHESSFSNVFLSEPSLTVGHVLVTPKRHVEEPWLLSDDERLDIFRQINRVSEKLLASALAEGIDVRQHYRPFLNENDVKVNHVHYHVLPRRHEDELYKKTQKPERKLFKDISDDDRRHLAQLLR